MLFGPIETNLGAGRGLSERHVAFYARRAAGGAGVIVTEIASVHDSDWPYELAPLASACGAGWAEVVAACRPHGALVLAGLGHAGGQGSSAYHKRALWAPSRVPDPNSREVPAELEREEIAELLAGFASAAKIAVEAGCDGVEVNAGQHSLLRQFLSGLTNLRSDAYGADRARLLRETLTEVRGVLGRDRVLGLRLCCDELAPWGGITPAEAEELARSLAALVDYLVPVRGSAYSVMATRPDAHTPPGFNRALCRRVRTALRRVGAGLPVVLQGSVVDPVMASAALADGTADLVEMTRAQLAEPELVALVRAGTPERIRPATLTNQHSWVRDPANLVISDDGEPATGHETEERPTSRGGSEARDVLVVGGGPAGLEAARVAALNGHRVRLVDRGTQLGGALRLAALLPGRQRLGLLADWLAAEVSRLGVEISLGTELRPADVRRARSAGWAVVLATGSRPGPVNYPVADGVARHTAAELLAGLPVAESGQAVLDGLVPGPVVVVDPIGDWVGVGIAELLAAAGHRVTIVTPDPVVGTQLSRTGDLVGANTRLAKTGVERVTRSLIRSAVPGAVSLVDRYTGERRELECSLLVDCGHRLPDDTFGSPAFAHLSRAGDCVAPRTVHNAILEGREVARECAAPLE